MSVKRSRQCQGKVRASSWKCQGKVKERFRQVKIKVKERSRGKDNYNLKGFDTIEINLVLACFC